MPYIGNNIRSADDYRLIDDISSSFNGSTTSFALQVAGSAPVPFPKSPQQVLISVNGVIQEPDPSGSSGFNLVGTNIVFSSAPTNGHAFFGIIYATADYLNAGGNFPAGSLGAPSITFIGDENTGLYRKGGGSIGFVADATEIANTDSNGLTISSGNLILPADIIHSGDTDTKIRFPAADTFSVETGGAERLSLGATTVFNETGADVDFRIEGDTNANLFYVNAGTDDIGIGTSSPSGASGICLEINGGSGQARLVLKNNTTGSASTDGHQIFSDGTTLGIQNREAGNITFETNGGERMRIDSSGFITQKFTSNNSSSAEGLFINNLQNTTGNNASLIFSNDSGNRKKAAISLIDTGNYGSGDLIFAVDGADSGELSLANDEKMRIDSSGRLLLGTSTARAVGGESNPVLHIEGSGNTSNSWVNLTRFQAGTASANFQFAKSRSATPGTYTIVQDGDSLGQISFLGSDGTDMANYAATIQGQVDGTPGSNDMPGRLVFSTTADGAGTVTERMRIDSSGNIGIGTTSPSSKLQINCGSDNTAVQINSTDAGSFYQAVDNTGESIFGHSGSNAIISVDPSASVSSSAIVFQVDANSEKMRIDSSGNVGIGTTSAVNNSGYGGITLNGGSGAIFSFKDSDVEKTRLALVLDNVFSIQSPPGGSGVFRVDQLTADGSGNITGADERLRIVSGGRLFLGCTDAINMNGVTTGHTINQVDEYKWTVGLRAEQTNKVGLAIRYAAGGNDHDVILFVKDTTVKFVVHGTGNVSNANNSYGQTSDVSLKENIVDANSQWNDIKNVKVRNFNFKAETGLPSHAQIGVVAQEIETTSPKLVTENEQGIKEVSYSVLYMKAIKALQEAMTRIETLETEVAALKAA